MMTSDRAKSVLWMVAVWVAASLSGAAALCYEVAWSRALVVPLGNSSDASAVVLIAFMLGIGAGAWALGRRADGFSRPLAVYALVELFLVVCALVEPRVLAQLASIPGGGGGWLRRGGAVVLILVPSLAMGVTLPLVVRALTRANTTLRFHVGVAYGVNTAGGALGAIATGFWGLSTWGTTRWSAIAGGASFTAAVVAWLASRKGHRGVTELRNLKGDANRAVVPSVGASTTALSRESEGGATIRSDELTRALGRGRSSRSLALGATFVSGFVMLACEMLWTRLLTFVFGHDTYAFSTLLALVLVGLAIGGVVHRVVARWDTARVLGGSLAGLGIGCIVSFWAAALVVIRLGRDPFGFDSMLATATHVEVLRELAYTPILVLIPSIFAGISFPAACSLFERSGAGVAKGVGVVALVNGVGSAAGALSVALGIVQLLGIEGALVLVALMAVTTGAVVIAYDERVRGRAGRLAWVLAMFVGLLVPMFSMPRKLAPSMVLAVVGAHHQRFLHYEEARTATVSVIENAINQERQLLINSVNEVTTRLVHDQSFKVLGHLGPLLYDAASDDVADDGVLADDGFEYRKRSDFAGGPRRGVMICLGAGISAGAALVHPLERLDVVDLSSAVAKGARYFSTQNNGVLDDPRLHLHINDGRLFLLNSKQKYDIAIIDSTHPKSVDSWILYTREFYRLVRERLSPGAVVVQWLPLHGLSEREFKVIVATFQSAFPRMTLWANVGFETYGQVGYAKLVGFESGGLKIDYHRLERGVSVPSVQRDLASYGIAGVEDLLALFVAGPEQIAAWTRGATIQTDDHPIIPYATRESKGRRMVPALLLGVREPIWPWLIRHGAPLQKSQKPVPQGMVQGDEPTRRAPLEASLDGAAEAQGLVMQGNLGAALRLRPTSLGLAMYASQVRSTLAYYEALSAFYPTDAGKQFEAATQLGQLGYPQQALRVFRRALELEPRDFRVRLDYAVLLLNLGRVDESLEMLMELRDEFPRSAIVQRNLSDVMLEKGDDNAAAGYLRAAIAYDPQMVGAKVALAKLRTAQGRFGKYDEFEAARELLQEVLLDNPYNASAQYEMGVLNAQRGELNEAITRFEQAKRLDPYAASTLVALGMTYMRKGRKQHAKEQFVRALRYDPHNMQAHDALMQWFDDEQQAREPH